MKTAPVFFALLALFAAGPARAAEADFYTLNNRWEKAAASGKSRSDAMEESFGTAVRRSASNNVSAPPELPPTRRNLSTLDQTSFELEYGRSVVLSSTGITKFLATDAERVTLAAIDPQNVLMKAVGIGGTFVHVWDATGRHTFEVRVTPPVYQPTPTQVRQLQAAEKSRPFILDYQIDRSSNYRSDHPSALARTDMRLVQKVKLEGDTPYGTMGGYGVAQKSGGKEILTDAGAYLLDGRIGKFESFNLYGGDYDVTPLLMALPEARLRGAKLDNETKPKPFLWDAFYGREKAGILGILTPGVVGKRNFSSFVGGVTGDWTQNEHSRVKVGYFNAHGRSRRDELNKHGMGAKGAFDWGEHARFKPEVDFDSEHFAHKYDLDLRFQNFQLDNQYRDVSKKFFTMLGSPAQQGELGWRSDLIARPFENQTLSASFDVFRDRLIFNPAKRYRVNVHREFEYTVTPDQTSSLTFGYRDLDDTGRIGPSKQKSVSLAYRRHLYLLDHRFSVFSRWENRGYRSLTNSTFNYVVDQFVVGYSTPLFWGIQLSMSEEYNFLREPNLDNHVQPHAFNVALDYSEQIGDTPFYLNGRARWRDEEETEANNSFMTGEDVTEISGGLTYREDENFELFITGRLEMFQPESLLVANRRTEAEILTGVRGSLDTGISWTTKGSFEGIVFKDLNADGLHQPDEPGLPGMLVSSSDGKKATTDAQGFYEIRNVSGRKATLTLDTTRLPYGFVPTTASSQQTDIVPDKSEQVDFGVMPRSQVVGVVFSDLNGDGLFQQGEPGVPRASLLLENGQTAQTRSNGFYDFGNVPAGKHILTLDLGSVPQGFLPSVPLKSDIEVFEGIRFERSFPMRAERGVSGRVFLDEDANGRLDPEDKGAANVTVSVAGKSATTDSEGYYLFDKLPAGKTELKVVSGAPAGYLAPPPQGITLAAEPESLTDRNLALRSANPRVTRTTGTRGEEEGTEKPAEEPAGGENGEAELTER